MSTPAQTDAVPQVNIEQLRARLAALEGEVVQLKVRPAPSRNMDQIVALRPEVKVVFIPEAGSRMAGAQGLRDNSFLSLQTAPRSEPNDDERPAVVDRWGSI